MRAALLTLLLSVQAVFGLTTNQLVIFGVTFQFSTDVTYGTFVNGSDYWVQAPVTVTDMLPAWSGTNNGWEVNPAYGSAQGFASHIGGYSGSLRPALPLTLETNCSLVKTIGTGISSQNNSAIQTAVVLTVLTSPPATNAFRPPYIGTAKPLYLVTDLQQSVLSSYSRTGITNLPSLETTRANFSRSLMMDHSSSSARQLRPKDVMADYQPANGPLMFEGLFSLLLDDTYEQKLPALIAYTQWALDRAYIIQAGYRNPQTGHNPSHRIFAAFGATMLNITPILTTLTTATNFHEDDNLWWSTIVNRALWGQLSSTEFQYWNYVMNDDGARSHKDIYGYVDGGAPTRSGYQIIVSQGLKGSALASLLMTNLQACFPRYCWSNLVNYADRWVTNGTWFAGDPAAPFDGITSNYAVTFGPNGSGSYILGVGRFLGYHGQLMDAGQYASQGVREMWNANRSGSPVVVTPGPRPVRVRILSGRFSVRASMR